MSKSYTVEVPYGWVPVLCPTTDTGTDDGPAVHSWTNPISGHVYETHPLGLNTKDDTFYDGFYEITEIEGLFFGEGESWDPDTRAKINVEKMEPNSIWNPFFQRYDPICKCENCRGVQKEMYPTSLCFLGNVLYFDLFTGCDELFFDVYCNCGMCDSRELHKD